MKKFLVLIGAMLLGASALNAQCTIVDNPDNKGYFGVRVSGDMVCPGTLWIFENDGRKMYDIGGGFEAGVIYNAPIVANFYVEPGLKLFYNTYSVREDALSMDLRSESLRKFGMRVPVEFGYHFDFTPDVKLSVFTGPELEVGITSRVCWKGIGYSESVSVYDKDGGMNRVNVLWDFGAGITYDHFYFGVTGAIGMCNMIDDSDFTFHENRVSFTVGYNF